ncbi:hypothetical protein BH10BDE1_BH10BDE1_29920 [soil metagenome]
MTAPFKVVVSAIVLLIALLLPMEARRHFYSIVAYCTHLPFRIFGRIARYILEQTETENPYGDRGGT